MNATGFRHLYDYHFVLNRKLWDERIIHLTDEQFTRKLDYSIGSVRNQMVHMFNVDHDWFAALRGVGDDRPHFLDPVQFPTRAMIRARWDQVEADMRDYLGALTNDQLSGSAAGMFTVWEVLFHVVNHGTDHRAQVLAMLHSLGAPTFPQDYILKVMGRI